MPDYYIFREAGDGVLRLLTKDPVPAENHDAAVLDFVKDRGPSQDDIDFVTIDSQDLVKQTVSRQSNYAVTRRS